jgi:hypothetical protein
MHGVEQFQSRVRQQSEAIAAAASDVARHFQTIGTAHADYAKGSFKEGAAFF